MRKLKKEVHKFLEEFHLGDSPTCEQLVQIIKSQGFSVVYFHPQHLPEYVQSLVDRLELHDAIQKKNGFTYCSKGIRFVFVNQTLSEKNKVRVLLHEEIHIYLNHFDWKNGGIVGESLSDEKDACTFAVLLQRETKSHNTKWLLRVIIPLAVALPLSAILIFRSCTPPTQNPTGDTLFTTAQTDLIAPDTSGSDTAPSSTAESTAESTTNADPDILTCYWTSSGTVYHIYEDCQHLKNSKAVQSGSLDDSGKERCCKTCYARYLKEKYGNEGE